LTRRRASHSPHRLEHRLQLARRTRDHLQHVGGSGLLLQRLAEVVGALSQLVQEPRVLDRDDSLGGEVLNQPDLLLGEGADLLVIDRDGADQFTLLEHRNQEVCSSTGAFHEADEARIALQVGRLSREVGNVDNVSGLYETSEWIVRILIDHKNRISAPSLSVGRWRVTLGCDTERVFLIEKQVAELRVADADRVRQHGLEHWLEFTRRAADDLKDLGCRRLLLQRLGQFACALLFGFE
jgi:hypothetical protein